MFHDQVMDDAILIQLLRLAWIAATLPILFSSIPIPIPIFTWLRRTLLGFTRRGKIMHSSSQKFTLPQRFFLHFYAVASIWTTFLLVTTWVYAYKTMPLVTEPFAYSTLTSYLTGGSSLRNVSFKKRYAVWEAVFLLLLMEVQVLRRLYESIYVFNYSPSARMHIIGYLTGFFFYIAAPLSLCSDCALEVYHFQVNLVTEFIVKGKNHMPATELDFWQVVHPLFNLTWKHWIGAAIFLWGWIHQYRCHKILGSLRDSRQADEYVIPRGDWFELVSSPHYLSEIVIYAGFVVATGGTNLTIWLTFVFVVANLSFAAVETHNWYHQKFEDYPSSRSAIIPFIL
ncbi:unnamed protein product [Lupinus luteus]|uniref:3-oxo-5-alpha-steroid 4-dehydrogenase C-terminal domain-containing protein n=1 Tax=Lupinus luteus TaxID=3873 RepID=A0AAV1Y5K8_LUPLU